MNRNAFVTSALAAMTAVPAAAQSPALPVVRLSGTGADDAAPYLYAVKTGAFRNAGFDTTYERSNSGAVTVAAVAGGSVDIGKSSMGSLISARAHNIDIKIHVGGALFRAVDTRGNVMLVVAADSPLRTAKDLNGKTVSVPALGDQNSLALRAWMDAQGGDSRSISVLEIPSTSAVAAIVQGRVAASVLVPPYVARAVGEGTVRIIAAPFTAIGPRFLETGWFTTADYAAKHHDLVLRFAKIMDEASGYANAHPAETAAVLSPFSAVPAATILDTGISVLATSVNPREIQPLIDAMAKYGMIPNRFDAAEFMYK